MMKDGRQPVFGLNYLSLRGTKQSKMFALKQRE